jgi:hypothetical protein
MTSAYKILVGKHEWKRTLGRPRMILKSLLEK